MWRNLTLAAFLVWPAAANAQAPGGLTFLATIEPIRVDAQPQQVVTRQFRLTLPADQRAARFKVRVEDWWRSEDGQRAMYGPPGTLRRSCARWVSLNPVEAAVKPGETLVVRISITVPSEIASAGYWCALTVDEIPDPLAVRSGTNVRFAASVSTGIFVNIGRIERAAQILSVDVGPDTARIRVRNDGNGPLSVDGRLEFFAAGSDSPMASVAVPRTTVLTEPFVEGTLTAQLPPASELPSGRYRVRAILDYGAAHYIGAEKSVDVFRAASSGGPLR
jgi:hypothetical protein